MTDTPRPQPPSAEPHEQGATPKPRPRITRTGVVWVTTAVALLLLVLLIIFILQNQESVEVRWFGLTGWVPLGVALLIAAVGGGVVIAIAGIARVTQLRMNARRIRRNS
ncbi:lipopolysaccharide assembly LapA domain-containing protein [Salinibacterium sp. ZJ450]|uniref:LapA family protein n=1 Tax=Salinibacterium sp. ZJ450 TaxID=2708338 RepID=UPI0014244ADC|nr:lipopolysaccharide assembly protein LapA domain-containing protein [Salinibacterium sp. ZJ450]